MEQTCSAASLALDEPMTATASRVERWLLVEHRGPWGPQSVPSSRLPLNVSRALADTAAAGHARLLLLRRPAGVPCDDGRHVFAVDSRPGRERALTRHVDDDAQLLDLAPPWDGDPDTGWHAVDEPLLLVCTHGRQDRCCAVRGRPVAAALAARFPRATWECSHIGGDRFAANLLVLPRGLYFGRVEAHEVVALTESLAQGELPIDRVRGRSSLSLPAQAAQHFARAQLVRSRLDDLAPTAQEGVGPDTWRVRLAGTAGPGVDVVVRYVRHGVPRLLTCGADEARVAPSFVCVEVVPLPA